MLKEGKKTKKKKERVFLVGVKNVCTLLRHREIVTQHAKKAGGISRRVRDTLVFNTWAVYFFFPSFLVVY